MIGGNEMKGKKLKTIISKIDFKKARPFILLTVIFTVLGLSFGKALDTFLVRMCLGLAVFRRLCFLVILRILWILHSFYLLFCRVP